MAYRIPRRLQERDARPPPSSLAQRRAGGRRSEGQRPYALLRDPVVRRSLGCGRESPVDTRVTEGGYSVRIRVTWISLQVLATCTLSGCRAVTSRPLPSFPTFSSSRPTSSLAHLCEFLAREVNFFDAFIANFCYLAGYVFVLRLTDKLTKSVFFFFFNTEVDACFMSGAPSMDASRFPFTLTFPSRGNNHGEF